MRIALCLPVALENELAREAVLSGHRIVVRSDAADELASRLADSSPDAVLASAGHRYLNARLLAESDAVGARLVALTASAAERRHVAELGLLETVEATAGWDRIEALATAATSAAPGAGRNAPGRVIAIWGPPGAPGRTTIAVSLAAELAATGADVLLCDADTHSASIAPALGLLDESPGFAAACRLAGNGTLTARELDRVSQRYESSTGAFRVLTGIGRPSRWPELSAERVEETLQQCRRAADYTVLDISASLEHDEELTSDLAAPRRNAATITAVRTADEVIAVGAADPLGLARFLRGHVDLLETATTDTITVVVNKVRASAIGMTPHSQIASTLHRFGGIASPVLIPYDRQAVDAALLSARTLPDAAPRSAARTAIRDLAVKRILPPVATPASRQSRRRLNARLGGLP
ncbi:CpaE family protein [Lysobacter korlensis]|uniref:CpaE family protein n=1 Tax=Lysobacter korlensis TaxID=553636 RepID=A0ABV6RWK9_9GAMM